MPAPFMGSTTKNTTAAVIKPKMIPLRIQFFGIYMMAMMMPSGDPQNMRAHMGVKLREFDADANGALTLEEFETLHMNVVRDRMVDRFQHLDADADGQITQQEMDAAGTRMGDMQTTSDASGSADHHGSDNE